MANPIIVDTIENSFIPLLIINNTHGEDAKILQKYKEPSWNYQVVRFLNSDEKDIIPRKAGINTLPALIPRMMLALQKANQPVPEPLKLLQLSTDKPQLEQAAFSCHCFWTGEHKLGALEGVIATEAGWLDGQEVTLVTYHKGQLPLTSLITQARKHHVANNIYLSNESQRKQVSHLVKSPKSLKGYRKAKKSDQKRQIAGTAFAKLNLTDAQACKVNAFCRSQPEKAFKYLTTAQKIKLSQ